MNEIKLSENLSKINDNLYRISALQDNYIWLYQYGENCLIVDPAKGDKVLKALKLLKLTPRAILITHEHWDHTDGICDILQNFPQLKVYASERLLDKIIPKDNFMAVNEGVFFIDELKIEAFATDGHSYGHFSYVLDNYLFSGDCLFLGGCGRVFTKQYNLMFESLLKLRNLDLNLIVCCGHEYSLANLKFVQHCFEQQAELVKSLDKDKFKQIKAQIEHKRANNLATIPFKLAQELAINPFLMASTATDFQQLREKKDKF